MKKYPVVAGLLLSMSVSILSADALQNNLTNMLNKKETTPSMVDLNGIDLNGRKAVRKVRKKRSSKAVVAVVNGHKVRKKEADAYLKKITRGKVFDFDRLPRKQRLRLIKDMSLPLLAFDKAEKELTSQEKEAMYIRKWMQKEMSKTKVTDDQVKEVYDALKKRSEENNSTAKIPEFNMIKDKLKFQMMEKQIIGKLMKDAEIKVH